MLIDFNQVFVDLETGKFVKERMPVIIEKTLEDGSVIKEKEKEENIPSATLLKVSKASLLSEHLQGYDRMGNPMFEPVSKDEKVKRFDLYLKIKEGGEIDLTLDEARKINELIGKTFSTIVVGQADRMLNKKEEKKEEEK